MEADPTLKTPAHVRREDQTLEIKSAEELVDPGTGSAVGDAP
jgi:hypothetical protein